MPGYTVHTSTVTIGGSEFRIRALSDKQQFSDPDGEAERAGISSAAWPIFGVLWPAGVVLAEEMSGFPIAGKRILEVGCGLGLSSLVLQRRGADITASDHHPLAGEFLAANAALNALAPPVFRIAQWSGPNPELGRFDLIIGGDVLYESEHVPLLAGFIGLHACAQAEVLISDPGRNHANALTRLLAAQGFVQSERRCRFDAAESPPFRGRLLRYTR
jgi:predicted nicotinamide N-methyase